MNNLIMNNSLSIFVRNDWKLNRKELVFFSQVIENDLETGVFIVGRGGFPNSDGIVQLDAAIMDGDGCQFGGVAGLEG